LNYFRNCRELDASHCVIVVFHPFSIADALLKISATATQDSNSCEVKLYKWKVFF
jgi:hypothetical protein